MVFSLERSSSLMPLVGLGVRSIDDQALFELLGHLPKALLNHAHVVIRASEATESRQLPRFVAGIPLVTPADGATSGMPSGAPLRPGRIIYLPRGWTVQGEVHGWRLTRIAEPPGSERSGNAPCHDDSLDGLFIDIARVAGRSGVGILSARCASAGRFGLRVLAEAGGLTMLEVAPGSSCHLGQEAGEACLPFVDHRDRAERLAEDLWIHLEHFRKSDPGPDGTALQPEIAAAFPSLLRYTVDLGEAAKPSGQEPPPPGPHGPEQRGPEQRGAEPTAAERIAELERELQRTRDDLERTRAAIDAGGFGYWYWEIGSNQLFFSRLQRRLFGLPEAGPITVRDFKRCVHPEDLGRMQRHIQEAMSCRTRYEDEYRVVHPDGSVRWLLVRGRLVFSGGLDSRPLRAMGIALDVTDRKRVEESLLQAQAQAEAANQSKSEFLANMSHEIRTPMTAILGYADLVAEQLADPVALQQVETIRRNGTFLLDIINDILDLSKIDAGKLIIRRQKCDVGQLITDICSLMGVRVQEKGLKLIVDFENQIPQTIETDPTRLRQVLVNLIGNAIKFTEHGTIEVVVRYLESQQQLEVDVIDTGIGIAEEVQAGLFAPFMQVDTSINRQFGGTGLGLAITRRLAEMLGGEVSFESKLGEGSRFTVAIATGPLEGVPRISPMLHISREESRGGSRGKVNAKILVVDDSRDIRVLASTLLKRSGATVTTADGGAAAVEAVMQAEAAGEPFGLVLMDVQMPGMDGPAAVRRLREAGFVLPIVAVTANAMQGDRERCLRQGYNDYLSKPLDVRSLNAMLEKHLRT